MRENLKWVEPCQEDADAFAFRIEHGTGSVCCQMHHLMMTTLCLAGDAFDADIMYRTARTLESLTWIDDPGHEHLRWMASQECDPVLTSENYRNFLKKELDF